MASGIVGLTSAGSRSMVRTSHGAWEVAYDLENVGSGSMGRVGQGLGEWWEWSLWGLGLR